jgi:hypothetical protein
VLAREAQGEHDHEEHEAAAEVVHVERHVDDRKVDVITVLDLPSMNLGSAASRSLVVCNPMV